ncbi:glycine--tRNA ligase subunit beta [Amphibacillus sp. Q70]|uniref:glycine--tRNA ligase subunit beta n=1 Tax=Amphibacillus sp. Q70 TaxID=3453416 RepID=UPI003F831886
MSTTNVLFEVGLEEMPARFLAETEQQLRNKTEEWLKENRLTFNEIKTFITPRRFAVQILDLTDKQTDLELEIKGPAKKIALDQEGNWTKAAIGFTKGQGLSLADIYFKDVNGTDYLHVKKYTEGKSSRDLLPSFKDVILSMNFPKNMRWANHRLRYVRPIKWLLALNDNEVVFFEIEGVTSGDKTYGHRFLGEEITLKDPLNYETILNEQYVVADSGKRKIEILTQIKDLASQHNWLVDMDEDLLEEVTQLVEYPTVFCGKYSEDYLIVPEEALITSMKVHQRYFPVRDQNGSLLPFFIAIRNGNAEYIENVIRGNEKVLNARLADALFFYQEDQKKSIAENNAKLAKMVFQQQLGTLADKVERVTNSSVAIAKKLKLTDLEIKHVERAAKISKFDLVTQMVDEFPNLQGIMGEKYARLFGENEAVAQAINEHYMPRHANDQLPHSVIGAIISVAEKMDTIVGCIGVGLIPSGSQDPYALRRQAMGVIQILLERNWSITFEEIVDLILKQYQGSMIDIEEDVVNNVSQFIEARIIYLAKEEQIAQDIIKAVTHMKIGVISHLIKKAKLLENKRQDIAFKEAHEALGRVINIANMEIKQNVDPSLFENHSEQELYEAYQSIEADYRLKMEQGEYSAALQLLESLTPTIELFFDQTMVMVDDSKIKNNRIALLNHIAKLINLFADFKDIEWKQHF